MHPPPPLFIVKYQFCIALHCIALHCIALYYITLHYITFTLTFTFHLRSWKNSRKKNANCWINLHDWFSREAYLAWEERCNESIESLEEHSRVKRPRLSIGLRQSLVARIAQLEGLKYSLRGRFLREGARHSSTGLLWHEIDTAFDSRVLTGEVLNSNCRVSQATLDSRFSSKVFSIKL